MFFGLGISLLGIKSLDTLKEIEALLAKRKICRKIQCTLIGYIKEIVVYQYNEIHCNHQK